MSSFLRRGFAIAFSAVVLLTMVFVTGCSDDPILGPSDGSDDSGGSYSVINRLVPDDSSSTSPNPERF